MLATAKHFCDLYQLARDAKKTRTFHKCLQSLYDDKFTSRDLLQKYESKNWNTFIEVDLIKYFDEIPENERGFLLDSLVRETGIEFSLNGDGFETQPAEVETQENPETQPAEEIEVVDEEVVEPTPVEPLDVFDAPENNKEEIEVGKIETKRSGFGAALNLNLPLGEIIESAVKVEAPIIAKAMERKAKKLILDAAKELQPHLITINNREVGTVQGKLHKEFKEAMTIITSQKKLFLAGDTGTGKTFISEQIARGLNLPFGTLSLTAGISEGYFIGRTNIQGDFISTEFIDIYENGGVFLLDEVDAADSNTLLILNKAISSNTMPVPMRTSNPVAKRHEDFYIVCAANTWGTGTDANYTGREYMDEAFLNRFSCAKLYLDYDENLERELLADNLELCKKLQGMRNNARKNNVMRSISTRTMIDAQSLALAGKTNDEVIDRIMVDYTDEERNKIKVH